MKKQFILMAGAFVLSATALADTPPLLNNVSYQMTEQQWVKATSVTAVVAINATVTDQGIAHLRQSMIKNLQAIAPGDWHITAFNRKKTSSGLENVQARAQIRLPADQFNHINRRAKAVSKAGQTYTVTRLNFNPSPTDIRSTETLLRQKIYQAIQVELHTLNKQFPKQYYFVHQVNFINYFARTPRTVALVRMPSKAQPNVSQQVTLTAQIILSSTVGNNKHD